MLLLYEWLRTLDAVSRTVPTICWCNELKTAPRKPCPKFKKPECLFFSKQLEYAWISTSYFSIPFPARLESSWENYVWNVMRASPETFRSASGARSGGKPAVAVKNQQILLQLMENAAEKLLNSGARKNPKTCSPRMPVLPSSVSWRNTAETCRPSLVWFWFLPAQRLWDLGPCRCQIQSQAGLPLILHCSV